MSSARRPVPAAQAPALNETRILWAAALLGALVTFLLYLPALQGPFVFDDLYLPMFNPGLPFHDWVRGSRPLVMLTYWLNLRTTGMDPLPFHLWGIVLHIANGILVCACVRRLLAWSRPGNLPQPRRELILSLFAGAVYLLHPLQTEPVAYIASRTETMSVFFGGLAYALFLYRRHTALSARVAAAVMVLFILAVLSKEHQIALPVLLLLTDYYWNPGFSLRGIRGNWRLYLPIAVATMVGGWFVWNVLRTSTSAGFSLAGITPERYCLSQCRAVWVYLRLFLLPVGQNVDHDFPLSQSITDVPALAGFAAAAASAVLAWLLRKRLPLASFGFLAFLLLLAPTSSVVPIKDLLVERRMYMPMPGLLLVAVDLLRRWRANERTLLVSLAAVLALLALGTGLRARVWASDEALWADSVSKNPANARARHQLAYAYAQNGRCQEAASEYAAAARLSPSHDARLTVNYALALDCAGRPGEAMELLDRTKMGEPDANLYATLGMIAGKQGMAGRALAALNSAEAINRQNEMIHFYRGNVFMTQQQYTAAATAYRRALEINPSLDAARTALAGAMRRLQGQ